MPLPTSHFSCRFHGMVDSGRVLGSLTSAGGCFSLAQESIEIVEQKRNILTANFALSRIITGINHSISKLHLHATRQTAADDIADGGGRFNR